MTQRPHLHALAARLGVVPSYHDVLGREHRVSDEAAAALLAAMGYADLDEDAAAAALDELRRERERLVPPATVVAVGDGGAVTMALTTPSALAGRAFAWLARITFEGGGATEVTGEHAAADTPTLELGPLPWGYHRLTLTLTAGEATRTESGALIVTPSRCWTTADALAGGSGWGFWTNLYTVRSDESWGIGDIGDLRDIVDWAAGAGAAFVGVNPLHAVRSRGTDISPYSPISRLFRNPLYVRISDVPEYAASPEARALETEPDFAAALREARTAALIDYDRVRALKDRMLRVLFARFAAEHRGRDTPRGRAFADYTAREGEALDAFATFMALEEALAHDGTPTFWREWPPEFRAYDAPGIGGFRTNHADEVDYHRWVQFELDRQLGEVARAARDGGMAIGLYQDLAVGTSEGGSDVWGFQRLFGSGATVGAPPDDYSATGQDWGLPPLDPNRLRESGYGYWIRLLRAAFRHAGALRIDHAMGLTRLYWIPPGLPATEGAYIRYPAEAMLGILALESHRQQAVVIAEDLGTVPEGFGDLLERWGILSSKLLWFEREEGGGFRPADQYPARALVTTTTHDHSPLASWWTGADLDVRHDIGLMTEDEHAGAKSHREQERHALVGRLREAGLAPLDRDPDYAELLPAVHAFLAAAPPVLLGVSLDDLAGERTPVNIPGVGPERHPTWSRRMGRTVADLAGDPAVRATIAALADRSPART